MQQPEKTRKVYITHCSAKKDDTLKGTNKKVTPDKLYTATNIRRFINKCNDKRVKWAIFSDKYGVWFPAIKHEWYDKDPNRVSEEEFDKLLKDFDAKLSQFDKIYFYYNPERFHSLYKRLLNGTILKDRVRCITHVRQIGE